MYSIFCIQNLNDTILSILACLYSINSDWDKEQLLINPILKERVNAISPDCFLTQYQKEKL
jgi:hypothetical protein